MIPDLPEPWAGGSTVGGGDPAQQELSKECLLLCSSGVGSDTPGCFSLQSTKCPNSPSSPECLSHPLECLRWGKEELLGDLLLILPALQSHHRHPGKDW